MLSKVTVDITRILIFMKSLKSEMAIKAFILEDFKMIYAESLG